MRLKYYAENMEKKCKQPQDEQILKAKENKYCVSHAREMTAEELIDAIRDKIQRVMRFNADNF